MVAVWTAFPFDCVMAMESGRSPDVKRSSDSAHCIYSATTDIQPKIYVSYNG
jgi:hypothetical protein